MRVDDKNVGGIGSSGLDQVQLRGQTPRGGVSSTDGAADSGPDKVSLSRLAEQVRELAPGSDARQQRIETLRALHESGRYTANPEQIADSLIEDALANGESTADGSSCDSAKS